MDELRLSYPACVIAGKMQLTAEDVDILREHVFVRGITTSQDAVILLAINTSSSDKCPEWRTYFIEAMTDFIVHHCYPQGAIDDWNADWLIAMISTNGLVNTRVELDLLFHIINTAITIPDSLSIFALEQLRLGLVEEKGAFGSIRNGESGEADLELFRQVAAAIERARSAQLSKREVMMLQQIGGLIGLGEGQVAA